MRMDARPYAFTAGAGGGPEGAVQVGSMHGYTAGGPVWKNHLFFSVELRGLQGQTSSSRRRSACRRRRCGPATSRNCSGASARSTRRPGSPPGSSSTRPSAPSSARRGPACRLPGNIIPANRLDATSKQLLEFYPEPNSGTSCLTNNYLVAPGSRDRQEPAHAADGLRAELRLDLDGPLQLRHQRTS